MMKKKTYMTPAAEEITIETQGMLAASLGVDKEPYDGKFTAPELDIIDF